MKIFLALVSLALLVGVGLFAAPTVLALFTDSHSVSGSVNVTSDSVDLYICDITGTDTTSATCPGIGDDSLGDEIIFEGLENLVPDGVALWDIRLLNVGELAWDSNSRPFPVVTEVNDPGADCDYAPAVSFSVLGKDGDSLNDNHSAGSSTGWPRADVYGYVRIHVEPGDFEDVRIGATLSANAGNECRDNAWDIGGMTIAVQQDL